MQKNKRTQSKSPSIPNPAQETKRGQPPHLLVTVKGETYRIAPVRLRQYAVHRAAGGTRDITEFKAEPVEQSRPLELNFSSVAEWLKLGGVSVDL